MPCFDPWGDILTEEEVECLEQASIILPQNPSQYNTGQRTVSWSIFNLFGTPSTISSELPSPSATARIHFDPSSSYTEIPLIKNGPAVLEYLGFNVETARETWQRFDGRPEPQQCPDSLLDYARSQANSLNCPPLSEMPIEEALMRIGLKKEIVDAIADPEYADIRGTASLSFWVKDTIETNDVTLDRWQYLLKSHAQDRLARKTNGTNGTPETGIEQERSATATSRQQGTISMGLRAFGLPDAHVTIIEGDPPEFLNHRVFFKGKSSKGFVNQDSMICNDGSINLMPLGTQPGGDFNGAMYASYWTPEKPTAKCYQNWAACRNPDCFTSVIQIQVPSPFLDTLTSGAIWYGDDWKEVLWCSKRHKIPSSPRLQELLDADMIRGHICSGDTKNITAIPREEANARITEDDRLKCRGAPGAATQIMFSYKTATRLEAELRGKIHFEIFGPRR